MPMIVGMPTAGLVNEFLHAVVISAIAGSRVPMTHLALGSTQDLVDETRLNSEINFV